MYILGKDHHIGAGNLCKKRHTHLVSLLMADNRRWCYFFGTVSVTEFDRLEWKDNILLPLCASLSSNRTKRVTFSAAPDKICASKFFCTLFWMFLLKWNAGLKRLIQTMFPLDENIPEMTRTNLECIAIHTASPALVVAVLIWETTGHKFQNTSTFYNTIYLEEKFTAYVSLWCPTFAKS